MADHNTVLQKARPFSGVLERKNSANDKWERIASLIDIALAPDVTSRETTISDDGDGGEIQRRYDGKITANMIAPKTAWVFSKLYGGKIEVVLDTPINVVDEPVKISRRDGDGLFLGVLLHPNGDGEVVNNIVVATTEGSLTPLVLDVDYTVETIMGYTAIRGISGIADTGKNKTVFVSYDYAKATSYKSAFGESELITTAEFRIREVADTDSSDNADVLAVVHFPEGQVISAPSLTFHDTLQDKDEPQVSLEIMNKKGVEWKVEFVPKV